MRWRFVVAPALAVVLSLLSACGSTTPEDPGVAAAASAPPSSPPPSSSPASIVPPASTPPSSAPPSTTAPPPNPPPAAVGVTVATGNSAYGEMLYDGTGQAMYLFDLETGPLPRCYGACAEAWPPVLTDGPPQATGGARTELLGSTTREDGATQVTYAGHPLYYYVDDGKDEVLCHDVVEFGGLWLVVTPAGEGGPH